MMKVYAALKKNGEASDILVVASQHTQANLPLRATRKAEKIVKIKILETVKNK